MRISYLLSALCILFCISCATSGNPSVETFVVVSTDWEARLQAEIQQESSIYDNVDFRLNTSLNSAEQAQQIKAAVKRHPDAIVVNPYEGNTIVPAIEEAYDAGINVILVGQKIESEKYTAYVGNDNIMIGMTAGEYVAGLLPDGGNLIEIESYRDAPFYHQRVAAFRHVLSHYPDINIVASFDAGWSATKAHVGVDSLKNVLGDKKIDVVFSYGDEPIIGACTDKAYPDAYYIGIDGAAESGANAVSAGDLNATFLNPSGGSDAVNLAVSVVMGLPFERDNVTEPVLINAENASMFLAGSENMRNALRKIEILNRKSDMDTAKIKRSGLILSILTVLSLLLLTGIVVAVYHLSLALKSVSEMKSGLAGMEDKARYLEIEREVALRQNMELKSERASLLDVLAETKDTAEEKAKDPVGDSVFMKRFRQVVIDNIDNPELSVDAIAAELGVSRAQMYRKVRAYAVATPNELIQDVRLERAAEMLRSSEKTVSVIAYSVGFTSPSYFSKCYKDRFGVAPSDVRG